MASEEGIDCEIVVRRGEDPCTEIVDEAERNSVNMIVMGTSGRKGMRKHLLGSVTGNVIARASPCLLIGSIHQDGPFTINLFL